MLTRDVPDQKTMIVINIFICCHRVRRDIEVKRVLFPRSLSLPLLYRRVTDSLCAAHVPVHVGRLGSANCFWRGRIENIWRISLARRGDSGLSLALSCSVNVCSGILIDGIVPFFRSNCLANPISHLIKFL